jgi:hypothetical protein
MNFVTIDVLIPPKKNLTHKSYVYYFKNVIET